MTRSRLSLALVVVAVLGLAASAPGSPPAPHLRALLRLPAHVPLPPIPEANPLTPEKIVLGRRLFYEERLSGNQTQ
ncbi:MAG: di-heme enzyme, partial [Pseudomonadota bacterium]